MGHIKSRFDEMISSLWRGHTHGQHVGDEMDGVSMDLSMDYGHHG